MIKSPLALRRWAVHGNRHYIGGDSDSATTSTNQTTYNDSRSVVNNDLRNYAVTDASSDSHAMSDIGNTWSFNASRTNTSNSSAVTNSGNTTITNTGTDAARIVELQSQMMQHMADEQLGSVRALAQMGADVSMNGRDLAMFSAKNSAQVSEHMLDITGDMISKLAGASASGAAMSATLAGAGAATAQANAKTAEGNNQMRMLLIGAGVLVALVALKK